VETIEKLRFTAAIIKDTDDNGLQERQKEKEMKGLEKAIMT